MPIRLDADGIVSSNCVFESYLLRKGDANLLHAPFKLLAATDLEVVTRLEEINKPLYRLNGDIVFFGFWKKGYKIGEIVVLAHPVRKRSDKPNLVAEVIGESRVAGEIVSVARVHANLDLSRDAPKVADGLSEFLKHLLRRELALLLIGLVSRLLEGLAPTGKWMPYHSGIRMPVSFSKTFRPGGRPLFSVTRFISWMMCSFVGMLGLSLVFKL